jgi:hypothetical protein
VRQKTTSPDAPKTSFSHPKTTQIRSAPHGLPHRHRNQPKTRTVAARSRSKQARLSSIRAPSWPKAHPHPPPFALRRRDHTV